MGGHLQQHHQQPAGRTQHDSRRTIPNEPHDKGGGTTCDSGHHGHNMKADERQTGSDPGRRDMLSTPLPEEVIDRCVLLKLSSSSFARVRATIDCLPITERGWCSLEETDHERSNVGRIVEVASATSVCSSLPEQNEHALTQSKGGLMELVPSAEPGDGEVEQSGTGIMDIDDESHGADPNGH